jgi:hypothetical protein
MSSDIEMQDISADEGTYDQINQMNREIDDTVPASAQNVDAAPVPSFRYFRQSWAEWWRGRTRLQKCTHQ